MSFSLFFKALKETFTPPVLWCNLWFFLASIGILLSFFAVIAVTIATSVFIPFFLIIVIPLMIVAVIGIFYLTLKAAYHFLHEAIELSSKENQLSVNFNNKLPFSSFFWLNVRVLTLSLLSGVIFVIATLFTKNGFENVSDTGNSYTILYHHPFLTLLLILASTLILNYFFSSFILKRLFDEEAKLLFTKKYRFHFLIIAFILTLIGFIPILNVFMTFIAIFSIVLIINLCKTILEREANKKSEQNAIDNNQPL